MCDFCRVVFCLFLFVPLLRFAVSFALLSFFFSSFYFAKLRSREFLLLFQLLWCAFRHMIISVVFISSFSLCNYQCVVFTEEKWNQFVVCLCKLLLLWFEFFSCCFWRFWVINRHNKSACNELSKKTKYLISFISVLFLYFYLALIYSCSFCFHIISIAYLSVCLKRTKTKRTTFVGSRGSPLLFASWMYWIVHELPWQSLTQRSSASKY